MLALSATTQVFLACGVTDLRKSYDGLSGVVSERLEEDPTSGRVFVFCNRRKDRLKILYFDGSGLCVWAKRLEKGTFAWPDEDAKSLRYRPEELQMLVAGVDLREVQRRRWYRKHHPIDDLQQKSSKALKDKDMRVGSRA